MSKEAWRSITLRGIETVSFRKVSVAEFQNPGADTGSQPLNESPANGRAFFLPISSAGINGQGPSACLSRIGDPRYGFAASLAGNCHFLNVTQA
jgi:hypothetical protein